MSLTFIVVGENKINHYESNITEQTLTFLGEC